MGNAKRTIAFVVPRYGEQVVGGAETLCRLVAEDLAHAGHPVEVFTTCALDHFTWEDALPPGTTSEGGVPVHRFPVDPRRDHSRFMELHHGLALRGGGNSADHEFDRLLKESVIPAGRSDRRRCDGIG